MAAGRTCLRRGGGMEEWVVRAVYIPPFAMRLRRMGHPSFWGWLRVATRQQIALRQDGQSWNWTRHPGRLTVLCEDFFSLVILRGLPDCLELQCYGSFRLLELHVGGGLFLVELRGELSRFRCRSFAVRAFAGGFRERV